MASSSQLRAWWAADKCKPARLTRVPLLGYTRPVAGRSVEAWDAWTRTLEAKQYDAVSVGTYNCRLIGGSTRYSLHSYGIAVDVDPYALGNPFRVPLGSVWDITKFTRLQVEAVEKIRSNNGAVVWQWGGRWRKADTMHWQINCAPADLATGVDWSTVDASAPPPSVDEEDTMPLLPVQYGHGYNNPPDDSGFTESTKYKADDVEHIQLLSGAEADGVYGHGTAQDVADALNETIPVLVVGGDEYGRLLGHALGGQQTELPEHSHEGNDTGGVLV